MLIAEVAQSAVNRARLRNRSYCPSDFSEADALSALSPGKVENRRESMCYARRGVLSVVLCVSLFLALPAVAVTLRPAATSRGFIAASKSVNTEAAGIFFSGSFGYSVGSGQAHLMAQTVTNPNGSASGPLRFSLWWTPNGPYPSAGSNTAQYVITPSLAPGASVNNI